MPFPTNPQVGQTYADNGVNYQFTAQGAWKAVSPNSTSSSPQQALFGVGAPSNSLGIDTDYYVDLATGIIYGPRVSGVWPAASQNVVFSPQNLVSGVGAPSSPIAGNANYYLDVQSGLLYGPKASGAWPTPAIAQIFSPQSLLSGTGAPASSVGVNTDYYVDFATGLLYGPKSAGAWPANTGLSIFSPQAFIVGTGAPSNSVGANGNYYVDLNTGLVYGPKVSGVWPATATASIFSVQSLLAGTGAPSNTLGSNGNYYIDTATGNYYGPKALGVWPATTGGVYGPGAAIFGTGAPSNSFGNNGAYYLDQASGLLYGPKAAGAWPAGVVLIPPTNAITGASAGSAPVNTLGANGEYFYDTFSGFTWGPKAAGVWPTLPISSGRQVVADASYVVGAGVRQVAYTGVSAPRVVTLPLAASRPAGSEIVVIDESGACSTTNTISATCAGSDGLNGGTSVALSSAYASVTLQTNGVAEWTIKGLSNANSQAAQSPQGRLTLTSLTPVLLSTVAAAALVLFTPYLGNQIPLWNGSQFINAQFAELSNTLANSATGNAGPFAACANAVFDLYVWGTGAAQTLTRGDMWQQTAAVTNTNASPAVFTQTAHGCLAGTPVRLAVSGGALSPGFTAGVTYYMVNVAANTFQLSATVGGSAINAGGASSGTITATEGIGIGTLTTNATVRGAANAQSAVNGLTVNTLAITNGPAAGFGIYVGSIMTDATGATCTFNPGSSAAGGGAAVVGFWNAYNQRPLLCASQDTAAAHAYAGSAFQQGGGPSATTKVTFVEGARGPLSATYASQFLTSVANSSGGLGIGLDSSTAAAAGCNYGLTRNDSAGFTNLITTFGQSAGPLGGHTIFALEFSDNASGGQFNDNSNALLLANLLY